MMNTTRTRDMKSRTSEIKLQSEVGRRDRRPLHLFALTHLTIPESGPLFGVELCHLG